MTLSVSHSSLTSIHVTVFDGITVFDYGDARVSTGSVCVEPRLSHWGTLSIPPATAAQSSE
eukprot:2775901-Prymnesium_polylepis.1